MCSCTPTFQCKQDVYLQVYMRGFTCSPPAVTFYRPTAMEMQFSQVQTSFHIHVSIK